MTGDRDERKYNGWTNYETWVVRLWLDNEEPSYRYWTGEARRWKGRDGAVSGLADQLKEELTEASPVNEPTVYGDLMNAALEDVNWLEIAESYLEEVEPADEDPETSTEGHGESDAATPEPTPEKRPEGQEPPAGSDAEGLFGPVLFAYTRRQALADGVLVDVTETAKEAGFRLPVALTHAVWAEYVTVPEGVDGHGQDETGRLWDILGMCRYGIAQGQNRDASEVLFPLHVRNDNREGEPPLVTLKAVCGPDDDARPCLTIMLPDED